MELNFEELAAAYAAKLKADRAKDVTGYLGDVKDLPEAELAARMKAALDRAGKVRVLSARPISGSSAALQVEHLPGHKFPAWRHREIMWRKGKNHRNTFAARNIAAEILRDEEISAKILNAISSDALWREAGALVSGILDAAFRGIDRHDLEAKKRSNIEIAKKARIDAWRSNLKESIKGLLREGIVCEEIQQALNEVLVESVQEM